MVEPCEKKCTGVRPIPRQLKMLHKRGLKLTHLDKFDRNVTNPENDSEKAVLRSIYEILGTMHNHLGRYRKLSPTSRWLKLNPIQPA